MWDDLRRNVWLCRKTCCLKCFGWLGCINCFNLVVVLLLFLAVLVYVTRNEASVCGAILGLDFFGSCIACTFYSKISFSLIIAIIISIILGFFIILLLHVHLLFLLFFLSVKFLFFLKSFLTNWVLLENKSTFNSFLIFNIVLWWMLLLFKLLLRMLLFLFWFGKRVNIN